jgi:hypothetical protein
MTWELPNHDRIAAVATMTDPVVRNVWITYTYHRLDHALAGPLGGEDVSWCAFGTWASKTAGRFIRGEFVRDPLDLMSTGARAIGYASLGLDDDIRRCVATGNQLVFTELAPLFRDLVELFAHPAAERPERTEEFLSRLKPGATLDGGQGPLRRAFEAYLAAADAPSTAARARLIFLANALVGRHEQTRLQPAIAAALAAPLAAMPDTGPFDVAGEFRATLTRWLMTIDLPTGSYLLGADVPPLPDGRMFPEPLETITDPELRALMRELDRTPDSTRGSAAADWTSLADRMNYIVDLFRSRQRDFSLRRAPFERDQVDDLHAGELPRGRL